MFTMRKRVLSAVLAVAASVSMAVPAFAAGNETEITGTYTDPIIAVDVPSTGTAVINPYGLGTTVAKSNGTKVDILGEIVSAPLAIKTKSTSLTYSVGATVLGSIVDSTKTSLKFNSTTTKGSGTAGEEGYVAPTTKKAVFVKLEVVDSTITGEADETVEANKNANADAVITAAATAATWNSAKSVVVTDKEAKGDKLATLKPLKQKDGTDADPQYTYDSGSIALFRLTGDCVEDPSEAWGTDDQFKVNIVFSFKPVVATTGTGS